MLHERDLDSMWGDILQAVSDSGKEIFDADTQTHDMRSFKSQLLHERGEIRLKYANYIAAGVTILSVSFRGWYTASRLSIVSRKIRKEESKDKKSWEASINEQLYDAWWRRDMSRSWQLARLLTKTGLGPNKKTLR